MVNIKLDNETLVILKSAIYMVCKEDAQYSKDYKGIIELCEFIMKRSEKNLKTETDKESIKNNKDFYKGAAGVIKFAKECEAKNISFNDVIESVNKNIESFSILLNK